MGENDDDAKAAAREALVPWRAKLMVDIFGANAAVEARERADRLRAAGDLDHAEAWQPIIRAIEELLRAGPGDGEAAPKGADGRGSGA